MQFDRNAGVVYNTLLETDLQTLLNLFFKHCNEDVLVNSLKRVLDEQMTEGNLGHQQILNYLGVQSWEGRFDYDEDTTAFTIKRETARQLLQKVGYIFITNQH